MACYSDDVFNAEEAWMHMASNLTTDNSVDSDFELSTVISDDKLSIGSDFVEELLCEISDDCATVTSDPDTSSDISSSRDDSLDSILSASSYLSASISCSTADSLSIISDDEGFASLEQCSASLSDFLNPDDFNALLDSLTAAIPHNVLSSGAFLGDACLNLSECIGSGQHQTGTLPTITQSEIAPSSEPNVTKPDISYIELVAKAIMQSLDNSILLADIYRWIEDEFPYYKTTKNSWRNSIRHNLSVNECFVKSKRVKNGRGFYWSIHPSCVEAFNNGDYDRRKARRQVQQCNRAFTSAFEELQDLTTKAHTNVTNNITFDNSAPVFSNQYQIGARSFIPLSSTPLRTHHSETQQLNPSYLHYNYNNSGLYHG